MNAPAQYVLIALAVLSAFTLSPAKSGVRDLVQVLFVPVALPAHAVGAWATHRLSPQHEPDVASPDAPRGVEDVRHQNGVLLTRLASLEAQLDDAKQQLAQYRVIDADLRDRVRSAAVIAWPTNGRQTITITTTGLGPVRERTAVIDPKGFVGQVYTVAAGGATARVLLASDPESRLSARFARFVDDGNGSVHAVAVNTPPPLVEGDGRGMVVRKLPAASVRDVVRVNDLVLLNDPALPAALKGLRLGSVSKVKLPATNAGFAEIEVTPVTDLANLRDVLVISN